MKSTGSSKRVTKNMATDTADNFTDNVTAIITAAFIFATTAIIFVTTATSAFLTSFFRHTGNYFFRSAATTKFCAHNNNTNTE
jgi:CMP-2-keto-3-deoxyoctulosonic acid synthetase